MTELFFRTSPYQSEVEAKVTNVIPGSGLLLDRTVFYPQGGGQPGDAGWIVRNNAQEYPVSNTVYTSDRADIIHQIQGAEDFQAGETVLLKLDWDIRLRRMKIHTALHLLSVVLPYPVTGGAIGDGNGRLDFDIPDANLNKEQLTQDLNELINRNATVRDFYISEDELDANPGLVKTMSVQPPRGTGSIRLVEIDGLDLQPCGGTHVRSTGEIGPVVVTNIEKKGKINRRVRIAFA